MPWAGHGVEAGSVFDSRVAAVHVERGLAELIGPVGKLFVARGNLQVDDRVRVRIPAREVILSTTAPEGLSLHNILPGRIAQLSREADRVIAEVTVHQGRVLAEVTADAVTRLRIAEGREVFALVKSVSVDVHRA